jgi:hypothetical protein
VAGLVTILQQSGHVQVLGVSRLERLPDLLAALAAQRPGAGGDPGAPAGRERWGGGTPSSVS